MAEVIDAARGLKLDDAREQANVRDAIEGFDVESRKSKDLAEREARLESECRAAHHHEGCAPHGSAPAAGGTLTVDALRRPRAAARA